VHFFPGWLLRIDGLVRKITAAAQPSPMWTGTITMTGTISMSKTDQAPASPSITNLTLTLNGFPGASPSTVQGELDGPLTGSLPGVAPMPVDPAPPQGSQPITYVVVSGYVYARCEGHRKGPAVYRDPIAGALVSSTLDSTTTRTNSVGRFTLQTRVNAAGAQDREYTVSSSGFSVTTQGTNNFVILAPKPTIDGRDCPFVD
jgi:hypothetical protein